MHGVGPEQRKSPSCPPAVSWRRRPPQTAREDNQGSTTIFPT